MNLVHRFSLAIGVAAAIGVLAVALHATTQAPAPGKYISWAPPASATASPGAGPAVPIASAPPAPGAGPLSGLTTPLSGLFKQLNANTAATARGQYSILQEVESALASRVRDFLKWVTGGR
jgi:hypothetical protein